MLALNRVWPKFSSVRKFRYVRALSSLPPTPGTPTPRRDDDKPKDDAIVPSILGRRISGVGLAAATAGAGFVAADYLGQALLLSQGVTQAGVSSPISGIPVAILLGLALSNTVNLPKAKFEAGLKFCSTTVLRLGIVCVGAKLSVIDLMSTGSAGIPVVLSSIGAGLLFIPWAAKQANLPPRLGKLLSAGTSICGVTAITALAPAINATPKETAVAVANVVAFGTIGMLTYPYLLHAMLSSSEQIGMVLGVAIHDTSQVLGGAMTYKEVYQDEVALKVAAITKLTRNLFLAGVIPGLTYLHVKEGEAGGGGPSGISSSTISSGSTASTPTAAGGGAGGASPSGEKEPAMSGLATFQKYVPSFLLGFIGMAGVRSCGDFSLAESGLAFYAMDPTVYKACLKAIGDDGSKLFLGTAMAAVGLSTSASVLKGVGYKPFLVGGMGAMVVGGTGMATSSLMVASNLV